MYQITVLFNIFSQGDTPYEGTSNFQTNYFYSGGIGYWFFFLLLALAALFWVYYDSDKRKLQATAWRIGTVVALLLLLPSLIYKLSIPEDEVNAYFGIKEQIDYLYDYQEPENWRHLVDGLEAELANNFHPLTGYIEVITYLGILGGLGGLLLAVAYYFSFQGQTGAVSTPLPPPPISYPPPPSGRPRVSSQPPSKPPSTPKTKAHAWLVSKDGRSYQLNLVETTIGRTPDNDIQLSGDSTISKGHAKITEQNGHFKIFDLASTNGTQVNNHRVRQPVLLAHNDNIQLGDHTKLRFITSQS